MGGPRIARRVERERQQHAGGRAVRPEGAQPAFFFSSSPNLRRSEGCDRSLCVLRFTAFLSADMVNDQTDQTGAGVCVVCVGWWWSPGHGVGGRPAASTYEK